MAAPADTPSSVRFAEFVLDLRTRELSNDGHKVSLQEQPFQILSALLERPGELVTRDELRDRLWPSDTFVDFEHSLNKAVNRLRDVLEDSAEHPRFIETLPRRGYRWIAPVPVSTDSLPLPEVAVPVALPPPSTIRSRWFLAFANRFAVGGALLLGVALAAVGLGLYAPRFAHEGPKIPEITRITTSGNVEHAAISPNGKYLAYTVRGDAKQSLWVQHVATGSSTQLLPPATTVYESVRFSQDSSYIYYTEGTVIDIALYQIPILGGVPRKLLVEEADRVVLSPDAQRYAFVREDDKNYESGGVFVAETSGSSKKEIATRKGPTLYNPDIGVAWSPDGNLLAVPVYNLKKVYQRYFMVIPASGGPEVKASSQDWMEVGQAEWEPDGNGFIAIAGDTHLQLWEIAYPGGEARRITHDLLRYSDVSITADNKALVTVQGDLIGTIWVGPSAEPDAVHSTPLAGHFLANMGLTWTPGGQLLYWTNAADRHDFILADPDGRELRAVPLEPFKWWPEVCPDGHTLLYYGAHNGEWSLLRGDLDGTPPQPIKGIEEHARTPQCSADGQWVVYQGYPWGALRKISIRGGEVIPLTKDRCRAPAISPDGKWVACRYRPNGNLIAKLAIVPFAGGSPKIVAVFPPTQVADCPLAWTPDGRAIAFVDKRGGVGNLWIQPIAGGPPKALTHFTAEDIQWFAWSRDGKQIAIVRGIDTKDAVMITNFH